MTARLRLAATLAALVLVVPYAAAQAPDPALVAKARAIHERVIALDTHNDINPRDFTKGRNYTQRLDNQVNLPKMEEGGLDASFFIVFVGQGPLTQGATTRPTRRRSRSSTPFTGSPRRSRPTASAWRSRPTTCGRSPSRAARWRSSAWRTRIRWAPT